METIDISQGHAGSFESVTKGLCVTAGDLRLVFDANGLRVERISDGAIIMSAGLPVFPA